MKPLLTLWFWSQNYKQYLQQPTATSKASAKRDVRSVVLNSYKTLCNSRELSATVIELVSVLIFMTVDKSFPSHTGNLVYSNARFTALEWFTKRVKTLVDIWKFSFAFSSRLSWLRLRFVKGECQKTINIMLCWWCITFGNLRYHSTSTSIDKDSQKSYLVRHRGAVRILCVEYGNIRHQNCRLGLVFVPGLYVNYWNTTKLSQYMYLGWILSIEWQNPP